MQNIIECRPLSAMGWTGRSKPCSGAMAQVIECRPQAAARRLADRVAAMCEGKAVRSIAFALLLVVCALMPLVRDGDAAPTSPEGIEWPQRFDGRVLRPLALSPVEQRFAAAFPGAIGRFSDGERLLVLRAVQQPTRMLHPAGDCYRGLGYSIDAARLERDARERLWRCFTATRAGTALRVCERIEDTHGQAWTDTSAWFWDAALGRSSGPWRAVTTVAAR